MPQHRLDEGYSEWNKSTYTILPSFNKPNKKKKSPILSNSGPLIPQQIKAVLYTDMCIWSDECCVRQEERLVSVSLSRSLSRLCCSSYSRRCSVLLLLPYDTCPTSHDPWIIYNHTTSPDESARRALWVGYSVLRCRGTKDDEETESVQIAC